MKKVEFIPINRTKMILLTVLYGLAGLIGFSMFYYGGFAFETVPHGVFKGLSLVVLLFFAVVAGTFAKRVKNSDAGLEINSKGITDTSSSISLSLIPWKDITKIETYRSASAKYILVHVKQPNKYLEGAKNSAIRKLLAQNVQQFKTPVVINAGILKTDLNDLSGKLKSRLKK